MSTPLHSASLLQLTCFVGVVQAGSFAEAGRRLGMTTSGISRAVSRLETEHAVRLLHRSTHALSLTEAGERVFEEARDVLRGAERLGLMLSQAADGGQAGRVRISAPPGFVRACLLPALPCLLEAHPEIQIEVHGSYSTVDLAEDGIDLAFRTGQLAGVPGHVVHRLFASPWCAYAAPSYLARHNTPEVPDDLGSHSLIGFRNSGNGRVGIWTFHDPDMPDKTGILRYDAQARITFDDGAAAYDLARSGYGIVWAPEWLAIGDLRCGRIVEVLKAWRAITMPMSIVRRERKLTPIRMRAVIDFMTEAAPSWQAPNDVP